MTDKEIEALVWAEIEKRGITLHDMIGDHYIDPDPDNTKQSAGDRARFNRFKAIGEASRLQELLCRGRYHPLDDLPPLKVSFQDLVRFWWNRCIVREYFVEEVLGEVFQYFTEQMKPADKTPQMRLAVNFKQINFDDIPN